MDTTYCSNCNTQIKEGAKFCTKCGTPVKAIENEWATNKPPIEEQKTTKNSKKMIIIVASIAIIALIFIGRSFMSNNTSGPLFDIDEEIGKIEGKWYDPNDLLLNEKNTTINFRISGAIAKGKDENNRINISLIPIDKNKYYATANLNDDETEFDATYYSEENKLVFVSKKTKTSWQLKKVTE